MPGDRNKSAQRKLRRISEDLSEDAWKRIYKNCELCGTSFVINNYQDHRPRTPKLFKRVICAWCKSRNGRQRMTEHILFEKLAAYGCLEFEAKDECNCIGCVAKRIKEKHEVPVPEKTI